MDYWLLDVNLESRRHKPKCEKELALISIWNGTGINGSLKLKNSTCLVIKLISTGLAAEQVGKNWYLWVVRGGSHKGF